ncbi:hypothetical protein B0T26DRAFT_599442, partial [Lasiosphaeria miniovina]
LPSPCCVLTSLVDTIASIPLQQPPGLAQQQEARTNPLRLVPLSHRYLIVTLHVLFPGLVLPALDLLDRGLVARVVLGRVGHHGYGNNTVAAGSAPQEATATVKPGGAPLPAEATYMVRLGAWNCTCAAFAFAAVSGTTTDTATAHTQNGPAAATETEAHGPKDTELVVEPEEAEWSFGGMSLGGDTSEGEGEEGGGDAAPMCKHLLACLLGERWQAALGSYVVERTVTRDEMAGIVADV